MFDHPIVYSIFCLLHLIKNSFIKDLPMRKLCATEIRYFNDLKFGAPKLDTAKNVRLIALTTGELRKILEFQLLLVLKSNQR